MNINAFSPSQFSFSQILCRLLFFVAIIFSGFGVNAQKWEQVGIRDFSDGEIYYLNTAVDRMGMPYVVYQDAANGNRCTVMKFNGTDWRDVGGVGFTASDVLYTSIAIDTADIPYVAYLDHSDGSKLNVVRFDGSSWVNIGTKGIPDGYARYASIAIDSKNVPYVVFEDCAAGTGVFGPASLIRFNGTEWEFVGSRGFSGEVAEYTSIAINNKDEVYMSYINYSTVKVKKTDGITWTDVASSRLAAIKAPVAIAVGKDGYPAITFNDDAAYHYGAGVARYDGADWIYIAHGLTVGQTYSPTIAFTSDGTPLVACTDESYGNNVTVKKYFGTAWSDEGNACFATNGIYDPHIVVDHSDVAFVAYRDIGTKKAGVMKLKTTKDLSVEKNAAPMFKHISIFPNPTNGCYHLILNDEIGESAAITITNILGQKVDEYKIHAKEDAVHQIKVPGLYVVNAITSKGNFSEKLLID